jgi:hypothetical protein
MSRVSWVLVLDAARGIVAGYNTAVTLRQLFYRLVSKQLIANIQSYYRRLSARTAEARDDGTFPDLADETSEIYQRYWYRSPGEALRETADNYLRDRTEGQPVSIYGRNRRASQLSAGNMDQPSSLSFGKRVQPTLDVAIRSWLVYALAVAGCGGEAMDSADGLIEAAEATGNPLLLAAALTAYGLAFRDADPVGALDALGRGLVIAQDSGNRTYASVLAPFLARLEAEHGDTVSAFDHLTLAIRNYHNSGDTLIRVPLAILAALFDRLGRYEPAVTIPGFALSPLVAAGVPEITTAITHLRDVLGEATYESLARKGETMTTAEIMTYAYDQIDQARTELEHPS